MPGGLKLGFAMHLVFHYNCRISWWIFTFHVSMETKINTPKNSYKIFNFILTVSSTAAMLSAV